MTKLYYTYLLKRISKNEVIDAVRDDFLYDAEKRYYTDNLQDCLSMMCHKNLSNNLSHMLNQESNIYLLSIDTNSSEIEILFTIDDYNKLEQYLALI